MTTNKSYRDIKRIVLERLKDGTWPADSTLPAEAELAAQLASTRTTVNRALRELADEGYLERKRRAGTRVRGVRQRKATLPVPQPREEILATGQAYRYYLCHEQQGRLPNWLAARLDLHIDTDALQLTCLHYAGSTVHQLEQRWIVIASVPEALHARFGETPPGEWLLTQVPFTDIELAYSAETADAKSAELMGTEPGRALFTAERTTWLVEQPVTFARMHFAPGYRLETRF